MEGVAHHSKHLHIWLIAIFVVALGVLVYASTFINRESVGDTEYGITFSTVYSQQLGVDPEDTYRALIEDLGVRRVRLPIYWSEVERNQGEYDWELYDRLVLISEQNNVAITPVVGVKVPRWPECFIPDWAEKLNSTYLQHGILAFIEETVTRYQNSPSVERWQVENEPFFPFGECPTLSVEEFQERVDLVRTLDDKPIQVTVSGEVGPWLESAQAADVLGISMYRLTWNDLFGYFVYPLSPEYYYFRVELLKGSVDKVIVSELQAEPWFPEAIDSRTPQEWYKTFTEEYFRNNITFVEDTGISEAYLWGAEWWYFLHLNGEDRLWQVAEELF